MKKQEHQISKIKLEYSYPLSPIQTTFLFRSLYAPDSDAYFSQSIFELEGDIEPDILKRAWQKISDYHPILRTKFEWENSKTPLQCVLESVEVPFEVTIWVSLIESEQKRQLENFIKADRKKRFDLNTAPLFRLTLIQLTKDKYYLIWSQHHILVDGWCLPIILTEVFDVYMTIKQKGVVHLKTPRPYCDYITWLQQQNLNQAEIFWRDYLLSLNGPTFFSFKDLINEHEDELYESYSLAFSHDETTALKKFAQQHRLTLNTVIQGAIKRVTYCPISPAKDPSVLPLSSTIR